RACAASTWPWPTARASPPPRARARCPWPRTTSCSAVPASPSPRRDHPHGARAGSRERSLSMKVSAAVAEILKREGVKYLIGYPVNNVIEAAAQADIRTIIVRQERVGLHMADAVSRTTSGQTIGVFAMQHGPGVENSFGG